MMKEMREGIAVRILRLHLFRKCLFCNWLVLNQFANFIAVSVLILLEALPVLMRIRSIVTLLPGDR